MCVTVSNIVSDNNYVLELQEYSREIIKEKECLSASSIERKYHVGHGTVKKAMLNGAITPCCMDMCKHLYYDTVEVERFINERKQINEPIYATDDILHDSSVTIADLDDLTIASDLDSYEDSTKFSFPRIAQYFHLTEVRLTEKIKEANEKGCSILPITDGLLGISFLSLEHLKQLKYYINTGKVLCLHKDTISGKEMERLAVNNTVTFSNGLSCVEPISFSIIREVKPVVVEPIQMEDLASNETIIQKQTLSQKVILKVKTMIKRFLQV